MKLLTHNLMTSKCVKGVLVGYPLGIVTSGHLGGPLIYKIWWSGGPVQDSLLILPLANEVKQTKVDFNPDFIARMIPKLDWDALCQAASSVGCSEDLPRTLSSSYENDEEFLKKAHHVLMEVEVVSGELICPETGRKFPVSDGIPNMLVNEDEV